MVIVTEVKKNLLILNESSFHKILFQGIVIALLVERYVVSNEIEASIFRFLWLFVIKNIPWNVDSVKSQV